MDAPRRFERVTDETDCRKWQGHGSWPDRPYLGLSEFEKFFFIDPNPRRIVQEYSYSQHPSEDICPRCGMTYYTHGLLTEAYYQGLSNVRLRPTICVGDTVIRFDDENYGVADNLHFDMTAQDWVDFVKWRLWLYWLSFTSPWQKLRSMFKKK